MRSTSSVIAIVAGGALSLLTACAQTVIAATGTYRTDYAITTLPNITSAATSLVSKQYAGLVDVEGLTGDKDQMFFWYFENTDVNHKSDRLTIWLNGGPGCSSLIGLLYENGPWMEDPSGADAIPNPYSWNILTNMLYVEQPVGVGFSRSNNNSDLTTNEDQVAEYFVQFMKQFYALFPETASYDLYITGESYAGHYIPYIGTALKRANISPLKAVAIGGPYMDSNDQSLDPEIFLDLINELSLVPESWLASNAVEMDQCLAGLLPQISDPAAGGEPAFDCYSDLIQRFISSNDSGYYPDWSFNVYNVRTDANAGGPFDILGDLIRSAPFQTAIHAITPGSPALRWHGCSGIVGQYMSNDNVSSLAEVAYLLDNDVRVYLISGDYDFIVSHYGVEKQIAKMKWHGATGFHHPTIETLQYNGEAVGRVTSERGLTYILVNGAGHMTPSDQPGPSFEILGHVLGKTHAPYGPKINQRRASGRDRKLTANSRVLRRSQGKQIHKPFQY